MVKEQETMFDGLFGNKNKNKNDKNKNELIQALLNNGCGVTQVGSDYRRFQCKLSGLASWIMITLEDDFPEKAPIVSVTGAVQHPWISKYRFVTGCGSLNQWKKESSLADIIADIKRTLEGGYCESPSNANSNGQQQMNSQNNFVIRRHLENGLRTNEYTTGLSAGEPRNQRENAHYKLPEPKIPTSFSALNGLNEGELQRLIRDEVTFEAFVQERSGFKDERLDWLEKLKSENNTMAEENLSENKHLSELRSAVENLQGRLLTLRDDYDEKLRDFQSKSQASFVSEQDVRNQVSQKEARLNTASSELGQRFLEGSVDVPDFLEKYCSLRKNVYAIKAKIKATNISNI